MVLKHLVKSKRQTPFVKPSSIICGYTLKKVLTIRIKAKNISFRSNINKCSNTSPSDILDILSGTKGI